MPVTRKHVSRTVGLLHLLLNLSSSQQPLNEWLRVKENHIVPGVLGSYSWLEVSSSQTHISTWPLNISALTAHLFTNGLNI